MFSVPCCPTVIVIIYEASLGELYPKRLKDETSPIYGRVTINGERAEFSIQRSILLDQWDYFKETKNNNSNSAKLLNRYFDEVKRKLHQCQIDIEDRGEEVTAEALKNAFIGIDKDSKTILQVFKEHNDRCKSLIGIDFAQGTYDRYTSCYSHVERFIQTMYHKKDMKLSELSPAFIKDFEFYLKTDHQNDLRSTRKSRCGQNSTTKYLMNFKKITNLALINGWLKDDPFRNTKFHLDKVDMDFLSKEELDTLIHKKMAVGRLDQVKDVYLFCCFTGLAFIDIKKLSKADIEDKEGQRWIKKKRQKTKNWCNVPLLGPAAQIMEKYKNNPFWFQTDKT